MNQNKAKMIAFRLAFLMEHQKVLPDLKEIVQELYPSEAGQIDRNSAEYLMGAYEALFNLLSALEQKGIGL